MTYEGDRSPLRQTIEAKSLKNPRSKNVVQFRDRFSGDMEKLVVNWWIGFHCLQTEFLLRSPVRGDHQVMNRKIGPPVNSNECLREVPIGGLELFGGSNEAKDPVIPIFDE